MKNTSSKFDAIAENPFGAKYIHKIIDLTTNKEIKADIDDFLYSAMINDDDVFTIGNTCSATISFSIINPTVNLNNKEIEVYQGLNVSGTIEYVKLGIFKVLKPKKDRNITRYQCVDRMTYLMNMPYSSNLTFPTTDIKILQEICSQVGITLVKNGLISHSISKKPSGYTKREIIAYMSQLQGKNARINSDGELELIWYTDTDYVVDDNKIYYDGISDVNSEIDYKVEYIECTVRSLDGTDETVIKLGSGTNGIKIENPFMTQAILRELANKLVGFRFRGAEFEFLGDFRLEVGDIVSVETNGEVYRVPIMQIEHKSDGGVVTTITSVGETDTESEIDLSSPNVHAMDRYYADLVLINKAMINKLDVDTANITFATISQLTALDAEIEGKLNVNELQAKVAELGYATIEQLDVETARIAVLEATSLTSSSAVIKDLQAGVTKTNTLIFGSASGETIQTEFSNSVIAQLGDAQIESAMIKEISASKITGLDLNTTNLTIHSEDGLSYWKDNTIVFHDGVLPTPRIQIGKDGSGDYNMYIWNAQGKLMFDALGVTEEGISRPIIRDDMVADNADINVGKLNIESLFNEINNNTTYTLKSSKIYLDDEKQTLDVSFKVMSSNLDNLHSIQSSQATDISVIQGKISSKIWQQDINASINGLEIGGRNLQLGTHYWTDNFAKFQASAVIDGEVLIVPQYILVDYNFIEVTPGDVITISVDVKCDVEKQQNAVVLWQWFEQAHTDYRLSYSWVKRDVTTEWQRISSVLTVPTGSAKYLLVGFRATDAGHMYFKHLKVEKGTKATDWTPAPEDVENDIITLNTQYSDIEQTINSISATVASHTTQIAQKASTSVVTNISSDLTTVKADLEGFKTTVSNTYTTKTDFNNLEIGGRNYIYYGKGNVKKGFFTNFDTVTDEYGEVTLTSQNTYASKLLNGGFIISTRDYEVGAKIVFSYDIMYTQWCPKETSIGELWMGQRYSRQTITGGDATGAWTGVTQHNLPRVGQNGCELNKWYHVEVVKVIPAQAAEGIGTAECIQFYNSNADVKATIKFRMKNVKIEYGTKATDWTPAPEDIDNSIANVDAKFASYSTSSEVISAIEQKANQITQTVSSTYATKTEFNNLEIGGRNLASISDSTVGYRVVDQYKYPCYADANFRITKAIPASEGDIFTISTDVNTTISLGWLSSDMNCFNRPTGFYTASAGWNGTYVAPSNTAYVVCSWTRTADGHVKLEKGNKATDWTPAPEDIDNSIANVDAKFASYSTTAEMTAAINIKANEITQEVSNTYATKVDFNNLEIGGRNLVTGTSSEYKSVTIGQYYTSIDVLNIAELCEKYGLKNGDILTYSVYLKSTSGKTIAARWQKYNSESDRQGSVSSQRIINGEGISTVQVVIDTSYTNLQLIVTNVSTSIKDNSTEYYKFVKLEKGTKATDWTPSPEDIDVEIKSTKTLATQTSNMMDWLVESGTSATNFTLTDRMAQLTAQKIKLNGYLEVDGNMLVDGAITAEKLAVDAIKSRNFVATSDGSEVKLLEGSIFNLQDGSFLSPSLSWDKYGKFSAKAGEIGKWAIQPDGGLMAETNTGTKPGTLNRLYLQPFNNTDYEDTWVISSQHEAIDSSGNLAGESNAYWYITGGGDIYTEGTIYTQLIYADEAIIDGKTSIYNNGLEIYHQTPYIDFHFGYTDGATAGDHTARIVENKSGALTVYNSISNASDERLKQDICNLDKRYLNALKLFNPVSYRFIKGSDNLNLGFLAQGVKKALLDCGITDLPIVSQDNDGMYALDYNQITALNTLGHIDHEKRIQQLENDLAVANAIIQSLLLQNFV